MITTTKKFDDTAYLPRFPGALGRALYQGIIDELNSLLDSAKANKAQNILTPTLVNGWVNNGSPYETVKYWKDDFGIVHLEGTVQNGTSATMFTLPVGYRPLGTLYFPNMNVNGSSTWDKGMLNILADGTVQHMNVPVGNSQSLNGITFLAEQ